MILQQKQWDFGFSAQKSRVRHTITEDHCKERGRSDVYHERGGKRMDLGGEKVMKGILGRELQK